MTTMQIYWRLTSVPELKGLSKLQCNELFGLVKNKVWLIRVFWNVIFFSMMVAPAVSFGLFHFTFPHPWIRLAAEAIWIAMMFPLLIGKARPHMKKIVNGCCPICEYDLRESSDRCPECGTEIAEKWKAYWIKSPAVSTHPE